jgi:hypothetical protein
MPKRSRTRSLAEQTQGTSGRGAIDSGALDLFRPVFHKAQAEGKNPLAVALGRLGGLKGGRARANKLTAAERRESASRAAKARWKRHVTAVSEVRRRESGTQ